MTRFCNRLITAGVLSALSLLVAIPAGALTLLSPTPDQVVRERVQVTLPESAVPSDFVVSDDPTAAVKSRPFVSLSIVNNGSDMLLAAYSPEAARIGNGHVTVYWNTKAPYRDPNPPKDLKYFKDGRYQLKVQVHGSDGKVTDSATVDVDLKNRIPRPNPAPAAKLVNKLPFGQESAYKVHADVQVFQVVSGVQLPILGGMGMTSDFRIIQNVEDIRPDGELMLRYRMDKNGYINAFGRKTMLYDPLQPRPQLYRLIDKQGNVITRNMFSRQGIYTIMDILPVLPSRSVKEGDSWPTTFDLKIEGLTRVIPLTGTSMLDSFEWQNGQECAKIISQLGGVSRVSINNDKIVSSSNKVDVQAITYFAYKTGKMIRREITMEFPATILPGAEQVEGQPESGMPSMMPSPSNPTSPYAAMLNDDEPGSTPNRPMIKSPGVTPGSDGQMQDSGAKKGSVQINVVVELEKK